jgi:ligand-binding sensor protein/anti-sigma regulatory factor (Ser/Thr protein kinase)
MELTGKIKLTDVIEMSTLNSIQEKMGVLVDVPQITTDSEGIPVGKISNFIPFCRLMRSSPKGSQHCILCDRQAGLLAMEERQRRIYTCHAGLIDCAAPIIVNDTYLGSVLGGQVLIKGEATREKIDIERISRDFDISLKALKVAVEFIPMVTRDELNSFVECYSLLANYIDQIGSNRLVRERLLTENQEKLMLLEKSQQMKFKTAQAQIHPHFLFNTLNSIARMALFENAPKTEDLIYKLSDLLRYNLKNTNYFHNLREEICNIERYLFIQCFRFSDRMSYEIDMDDFILDCRIPTMVLQPIVENCMLHGLETKKEGGKVEITGHLSGKDVEIKIIDNGNGIKPEVLQLIRQMGESPEQHSGIGLINTYERLRHHYGDRFSLTIESAEGVGTSVTVRIPFSQFDF